MNAVGPGWFIFFNICDESSGGVSVYGDEDFFYDDIDTETVKELTKKVAVYREARKAEPVEVEAIKSDLSGLLQDDVDNIVESMAESLSEAKLATRMRQYHLDRQQAIDAYKNTLVRLMNDDDLALLLIFMSI